MSSQMMGIGVDYVAPPSGQRPGLRSRAKQTDKTSKHGPMPTMPTKPR